MSGKSRVGERRGILSTLVGCREVLLKEAVKLREEGCGDSQMEMGGGVVGIGKFQREKGTWMGNPVFTDTVVTQRG